MLDTAALKLTALGIAAGLLIGGCAGGSATEPPAEERRAQATTRPLLKEVDLLYGIYLARLEVHTTITPDGLLRSVRIENKSYGPEDLDASRERRAIREGRLTPEQMTGLAVLFAGWESLSTEPYGGVPDGGGIRLRYGDKTVSGGSAVPKPVWDIHRHLDELAAKMPITER